MKKKTHISHKSIGFFVVVSGVISLSSVVSSFYVLSAPAPVLEVAQIDLPYEEEYNLLPGLTRATNEAPVLFGLAPTWNTVDFSHAPNAVGQPITYVRVTSTSQDPIEIEELGFVLKTSSAFDGALALVKIPGGNALDTEAAFGFGLPEEGSVTSTVAMTSVQTEADTETSITLPFVKGTILPAGGSMIFAVTLDNAPTDTAFTVEASVLGMTWKNFMTQQHYFNDNIMFAAPRATFNPEE